MIMCANCRWGLCRELSGVSVERATLELHSVTCSILRVEKEEECTIGSVIFVIYIYDKNSSNVCMAKSGTRGRQLEQWAVAW